MRKNMSLNSTLSEVTQRIVERSKATREEYLDRISRSEKLKGVSNLSCGNIAHASAA